MILPKLKEEFLNSQVADNLIDSFLLKGKDEHFIHGITDTAKGFFLTNLLESRKLNKTVLFLASNNAEALNIYYEALNLTSLPVFYFCSHEVSPYDQISSDADIISHQIKTVLHLIQKKTPCLIITTAKYLSEKIWNREDIVKNCFSLTKDSTIDTDELSNNLVKLGYKRVPVVTSRGEFSIRGDIIDIYSTTEAPTRISLFGFDIESIRTYSLTSQRSLETKNSLFITPRYYVVDPNIKKIESHITQYSRGKDGLKDFADKLIEELRIDSYFESIEYYANIVNQRQFSLFDYLPSDTFVITDDWEENGLALNKWLKRNEDVKNELEKSNKLIKLKEELLHNEEFITKELQKYKRCFIERFDTFDEGSPKSTDIALEPVERFNNQIDLFIKHVKDLVLSEKKVVIFSDQPQRVNELLKEWEVPGTYAENLREQDYEKNNLFISSGGTTNGFKIPYKNIHVITDQEIFGTKRKTRLINLKKDPKSEKYKYYTNIEDIKPDDFVVHIKHGIGRYRGLVKITVDTNEREYLMIEYASEGKLYLPVEQINMLYRYKGANEIVPKLSRLGGSDWETTKKKVKKAIKKVAEDLLNLYTARSKLEGHAFNKDSHWQVEMEEAFPYVETPDQMKAINDSKKDMESNKPMDRLVCGDVGYGKTEVAIRAMFKAVLSGKQVAVLVPTTILAQQHFNVISERLAAYPVRVALLSRFRTNKEQKTIIGKLALGEVDIVIGTHRLLQKDVIFKDLGLVVIDEEQRFGVLHKEKLKQLRVTVDVLTLSATPIPRTLYMALSGARDLSIINTPPTNRLPIKTHVGEFKPTIVKNAILHELERGGQVYFVHNRVETIERTAAYIKELVPEANVSIGHGQMNDKDLENVMFDFLVKKSNVLVCTTIIESGLDIPNVNTMIVDNANNFGLAQLYQIRGRVGRTDVQAYAYCLYEPQKILTDIAKNRLAAIKEFSSLGSGYQIALRDMEIRGVGNILGSEQHGHMISVGFDLYCRLLNEAVDKMRGLDYTDPESETEIDINVSAYIPSSYIQDEGQKVIEYKRLATIKSRKELGYIEEEWKDRFGKLPEEATSLLKIIDIRISASELGIKTIKTEKGGVQGTSNIKVEVDFRLQKWLSIQKKLSKRLIERTSFKSVAKGGSSASNILVKTLGLNTKEELELLSELLTSLKFLRIDRKIA